MRAPCKIYVDVPDINNGYEGDVLLYPEEEHENYKEYINKDALIEWAKEKLKNLKVSLDTDPYKEAYIGKCEVLKELMDKLNSL